MQASITLATLSGRAKPVAMREDLRTGQRWVIAVLALLLHLGLLWGLTRVARVAPLEIVLPIQPKAQIEVEVTQVSTQDRDTSMPPTAPIPPLPSPPSPQVAPAQPMVPAPATIAKPQLATADGVALPKPVSAAAPSAAPSQSAPSSQAVATTDLEGDSHQAPREINSPNSPNSPNSTAQAGPDSPLPESAVRYRIQPKMEYPSAAREFGESGVVVLRIHVDENGVPVDVSVKSSSGYARLDKYAAEQERKARFFPHLVNGVPQPWWRDKTVTFALQ